jgi:hypothetical protein
MTLSEITKRMKEATRLALKEGITVIEALVILFPKA